MPQVCAVIWKRARYYDKACVSFFPSLRVHSPFSAQTNGCVVLSKCSDVFESRTDKILNKHGFQILASHLQLSKERSAPSAPSASVLLREHEHTQIATISHLHVFVCVKHCPDKMGCVLTQNIIAVNIRDNIVS